MKIALGTDHAGYQYKEAIKSFLQNKGHEIRDFGTNSDVAVDYPVYIRPAALAVAKGECDRAIVLGGTGNGEAMVANRYPHVRAAVYYGGQPEIVPLSREHNDANILSLGARFVSEIEAREVITRWLETKFSDEARHARRIAKIDDLVPVENEF
jgi:ribose 5-phosphate isomerase B